MSYADVHDFLADLAAVGELHAIAAEVEPDLEIAEITARVMRNCGNGMALMFEKVAGAEFPVVTNLFGSERRLALALGRTSLASLERDFTALLSGTTAAGKEASEGLAGQLAQWAPVVHGDPPARTVEEVPDLTRLPALRNWIGDGGRFLTLPLVFTPPVADGSTNCGMYRIQILDRERATINFGSGSGGEAHLNAWSAAGKAMPVVIALGGPPAVMFSATVPLPENVDELALAGFLQGKPVRVTPACAGRIAVPAGADFILEGEIVPGEAALEGPFGNHTGFYAAAGDAPVFRLTRMTRRTDAVVPATVVGPPPAEDLMFVRGWERLLLPWLRLHVPEVVDISFILEAAFHRAAVVAVGAERAHGLAERLRACEPLRRSRLLVLVDADVSPGAYREIFWRSMNSPAAESCSRFSDGGVVVDARRLGRSQVERGRDIVERVDRRWKEYGFES